MTTRRVWSIEVRVYATAYIIADTEAEARKIARALPSDSIDCEDRETISGEQFDSPDLPELSFSPAMTIDSTQPRGWLKGLDLAEECEMEDEDEEPHALNCPAAEGAAWPCRCAHG